MRKAAIIARGLVLAAAAIALFGAFYYVYVPLLPSFQLVLVPLLLLTAVLTALRLEWGALWFVFAFPLFNSLPYFFGIDERIPHAPVALVLFLAFFIGWLVRASFSGQRPRLPSRLSWPLTVLSGLVVVSGLVTLWRYANFPPLLADRFHDLIVNVNQVRAGGAVMSGVFNALNYLSGFLFLGILGSVLRTRAEARKFLVALSLSASLAIVYSLAQKYISLELGNTPAWVRLGQQNATFKDPNAFGAFLSAGLPLFLAMALSFRKGLRILSALLVVFILFVFPAVGSRSGFLAICISMAVFCVFILGGLKAARKKTFRPAAVLLGLVIILLSLTFFQGGSRLFRRLAGDPTTVYGGNLVSGLFTGRLAFWEAAGRMVGDYPVTGVGLGAYIIELPNYLRSLGKPSAMTDSAENYFIQAGAELGLVGFGLALGIFVIIFWPVFRAVRMSRRGLVSEDKDRYLPIGISCGLLALGVNFLFHSYIGSFEVIYTFWLLVALAFHESPRGERNGAPLAKKPARVVFAASLVVVFGLVHLWNSTRSLSLVQRTERFGWSQNFGLYQPEQDPGGYSFHWTKRSAGVTVEEPGPALVIPMRATHPDIESAPVRTRVFLADASFRKKALLREMVFTAKDWVDLEFPLAPPRPKKVHLVFETDRAWQPRRALGVPDTRQLALALGEAWSRYPSEIPEGTASLRETIPAHLWSGQEGENLVRNGLSRMKVKWENPGPLLRMWLKGRKVRGIGPFVVIRLDGRTIGKTQVLAEEWTPYVLSPDVGAGEHVLSVEFTNDFYAPETGEDRNAYLGSVDILSRK